jgi:Sigma-70 region 2
MRHRHSISLKDFLPEGEDTKFENVEEILLVAKRRMHAQSEAGEAIYDWGLVARAKSGCSTAFGQLYERHRVKVYHTILRVVRQREDAEDAAQRCFQRAFTKSS